MKEFEIMGDNTFGSLIMGDNLNPYVLIALAVASCVIGMFSHWMKKQYRDGMEIDWFSYFFVTNRRATLAAFLGGMSALFAAFVPIDYTTISGYQVVVQAFSIGYAVDSVFNTAEVTEAKQEVHQERIEESEQKAEEEKKTS
jgi:hypothetical protein